MATSTKNSNHSYCSFYPSTIVPSRSALGVGISLVTAGTTCVAVYYNWAGIVSLFVSKKKETEEEELLLLREENSRLKEEIAAVKASLENNRSTANTLLFTLPFVQEEGGGGED